MSIVSQALDRIGQTKKTLEVNMSSPNLEYMAFIGALVECNLLIEQYREEKNKDMVLHHVMMKNEIIKRFEKYCIDKGYKYRL